MHTTQWKPIPAFPNYEISSDGQVRVIRNQKIKVLRADRKGYHSVVLWVNSQPNTRLVAPLVAAAFIGEKPAGHVVRHKNGIKTENTPTNLCYGTPAQNEHDKRAHGTAPIGENHPAAKLTAAQVAAIRARYQRNSRLHGCNAIGKDYGVTGSLIRYIIKGKLWK